MLYAEQFDSILLSISRATRKHCERIINEKRCINKLIQSIKVIQSFIHG